MSVEATTFHAECVGGLTDEQWALVASLIPIPPRRDDGRGRPWRNTREVLDGILWVLRSNARWQDLPDGFPPYQTCHRRFQEWVRDGVLRRVLEALAEDLRERGCLDVAECLIEGASVIAKRGDLWERVGESCARSSWQWQTAMIFLSPATRKLLRRMHSPLSQRLSL